MDSLARISIFLILITLLASCAIAPGFDPPNVSGVTIRAISSDLIAQQQRDKQSLETQDKAQLAKARIQEKNRYRYLIGAGDVLSIIVWEQTEFNEGESNYVVDKDGTIFFPYVGKVRVAGKTTAYVRDTITQRLAVAITSPQVDVKVAEFRSTKVYVVGEVEEPGHKPITDIPMTVVDAISVAGGATTEADLVNVKLTRGNEVIPVDLLAIQRDGDIARNILLKDGDILHVPNKKGRKIYVLGEVMDPASLLMEDHSMSLTEALNDAGNINPFTANPANIYVIRGEPDDTEIYYLDARTPTALVLGDHFQLKPRDVVYVDTAGVTRWNRVISQILPSVQFLRPPSVFGGP